MDESAIRQHVERARAGEGEALGELFRELRPELVRLCTRLLGPGEAEDAANDAFQRAHARLDSYDRGRPFRAWLLSIAAHHCIDRLRRRSVEKRLFEPDAADLEDLAGSARSALDGLIQLQRQEAVRGALDRLPDRYRAPLVLRHFVELGYDAIGEELGLSRSQVATLIYRARQRLREILSSEQETDR